MTTTNNPTENVSVDVPEKRLEESSRAKVVLLTDSCCNPASTPGDQRTYETIQRAIVATGAPVDLRIVTATQALTGGLPADVLADVQAQLARGAVRPPIVLIDGKIIANEDIDPSDIETALGQRYDSPPTPA